MVNIIALAATLFVLVYFMPKLFEQLKAKYTLTQFFTTFFQAVSAIVTVEIFYRLFS